ncbi:hypothetical protein AB1L42_17905 [Thalassoglobus sp. JC818]|uniref:hypothetical protein n=1 Tax=Thalassoglobus sp. JC818 TaxID=3232136 RepID=UPI003459DE60
MNRFNTNFSRQSLALFTTVSLLAAMIIGCRPENTGANAPTTPLIEYQSPPGTTLQTISKIWDVDSKEDLSTGITLAQDEGVYLVLEVQLAPDQNLDSEIITDPRRWACLATIYPKDSIPTGDDALHFGPEPIFTNDRPMCSIVKAPLPRSDAAGYRGPLEVSSSGTRPQSSVTKDGQRVTAPFLKQVFPVEVSPYWTFVSGSHFSPGSYVIEFRTFPCLDSFSPDLPKNVTSIVIRQLPLDVVESKERSSL